MDFLKDYVKTRKKMLLFFFLSALICFSVFLLYHLPLEAVGYPMLLCLVLGLFFFFWDFSQKRQKYEKLCKLNKSLDLFMKNQADMFWVAEDRMEEQYQELLKRAGSMYREKEETAETSYRQMVEYYMLWVHQIKTPIAAMRLLLESEDSTLSKQLSFELFRIEQYVEMVMTYLRLDERMNDFVLERCRLDDLMKPVIRKFAKEFIGRKLSLQYQKIEKEVITDEKWLSFVLEQILSNALKYTKKGTIQIYLEGEDTLCIEDTGIGIAPQDLPRIFEKGYTGYNGRSDKRASGIGLYLCKRICGKLGFEIRVSSEIMKGTKVRILLCQKKVDVRD